MGTKNKVLVIAECGHNANGSMRHMKLQIEEAKKCGADIAKFQAYDIDTIMTPDNPVYMELKMSQLSRGDIWELNEHCKKVGIEFMASAFDPLRVEWLEEVNVKRHKLASRMLKPALEKGFNPTQENIKTIKDMEKTGKPIIASLGMFNFDYDPIITSPDIKNVQYLYCVADYPATITEENFPKKFGELYQGFSDHTIGIEWAKEAVRRGATIIEKHFTLDKRLPGCDQKGSADPKEMEELVEFIKEYNG